MMHQVLYIVQLPNEEGDMHIIYHLVHHDMPCDPDLVSSAFYTILSKLLIYLYNCTLRTRHLDLVSLDFYVITFEEFLHLLVCL